MSEPHVKPQEFRLLRDLVQRQIGVCLSDAKSVLLESRLRGRLRELGLDSFLSYYQHLVDEDRERTELEAAGPPVYELPMITEGVDLSGLHRLAAELRDQGAA